MKCRNTSTTYLVRFNYKNYHPLNHYTYTYSWIASEKEKCLFGTLVSGARKTACGAAVLSPDTKHKAIRVGESIIHIPTCSYVFAASGAFLADY